ncbi:MAG TPA: cation-transporting P-type ATPase, partial [Steroidobacteraceae bacterium]
MARTAKLAPNVAQRVLRGGSGAGASQALSSQATLEFLETSDAGLTRAEAEARLERDGPNLLPAKPPPGALEIGLRQLKSPLIYILLVAAV